MERPAKRQKLEDSSYSIPTRTLDLNALQRTIVPRRPSKIILPRRPDITVTAGLLEVAINEGSVATQISLPTSQIAVPIGSLGTLTLPGLTSISSSSSSSFNSTSSFSTLIASNSTTTQRTVTVTAVSTFHVSYKNGTFIAPHTHQRTRTDSDDDSTTTETNTYIFGQGVTDTYTPTSAPTQANVIGTTTSSQPTSSPSSAAPAGPTLTPEQTQMVGGIVGGVAGIALVLIALLYLLRWYRNRFKKGPDFNDKLVTGAAPMSSSKSFIPVAAHAMKKLRPTSDMTTFTSTTSLDSEKGFARLSGRKIAPVLSSGGDQYGGSYGIFEKQIEMLPTPPRRHNHDLSETSFYRDSGGLYISDRAASSVPGTPVQSNFVNHQNHQDQHHQQYQHTNQNQINQTRSPRRPFDINTRITYDDFLAKPDGVAVFRGSPARTPVTQSPNTDSIKLPIQAPVTMDEDIPEMPLPSPNIAVGTRNFSRLSNRGSGRFREEMH